MSDRKALLDRLRVGLMASAAFVRDSKSKDAQARMKDALDAFEEVSALLSQPSPSDEVRGLIADCDAALGGRPVSWCEQPLDWAILKKRLLALTPPSPVSGEGDDNGEGDNYAKQYQAEQRGSAPSRPPEPAASGEPFLPADLQDLENITDPTWRAKALRSLAEQLTTRNDFYYLLLSIADKLTRPPESNARTLTAAEIAVIEGKKAYNAGEISDARKEMLDPWSFERIGKLPPWARAMTEDLVQRIVNLRAALALPADDEAKRIRAEVIEEIAHWYETKGWLGDEEAIAAAIRALAQPGQGGAT